MCHQDEFRLLCSGLNSGSVSAIDKNSIKVAICPVLSSFYKWPGGATNPEETQGSSYLSGSLSKHHNQSCVPYLGQIFIISSVIQDFRLESHKVLDEQVQKAGGNLKSSLGSPKRSLSQHTPTQGHHLFFHQKLLSCYGNATTPWTLIH